MAAAGIAAVRFIEMMSAVIRDSGDHQRAVVVPQDHMLIEQDFDSEADAARPPRR